jgi:hypothetical protein
MIHSCTRCELRFITEGELREHLIVDHETDPETLDHDYPPDNTTFKPLYPEPDGATDE